MTRELPDELLSAYLDGEVTAEERAEVELHLATNEAARQLLEELRSLRGDMAALPRVKVTVDFSDRVIQAAVAARAASAKATVNAPLVAPAHSSRQRWLYVAVGIAAAAACLFIAVQFWKPPAPGPIAEPVHPMAPIATTFAALHGTVPEGQAVVVRLRLPKGLPLEQALVVASASAGIGSATADAPTGAGGLGAAYQAELTNRIGAESLTEKTIAAADAVFVEAPLSQLEKMLTVLSTDAKGPLELHREALMAFVKPKPEGGAAGSDPENAVQIARFFMQRLPAGFRLEKAPAPPASEPPVAAVNGDRLMRVLILIEQVEAP